MIFAVDERNLWRRCLDGDSDAFHQLYLLYYPRLTAYGRHLVKDSTLVEDCIQDLFVKMIQNGRSLSDTTYLSAYLFKALRHKIVDVLRSRKTIIVFDSDMPFSEAEVAYTPPLSADGEVSEQRLRFVLSALKELSPNQQEVVYLFFTKGLSHDEIASVLGINSQSSRNLMCRAVAKLRRLYAERYTD